MNQPIEKAPRWFVKDLDVPPETTKETTKLLVKQARALAKVSELSAELKRVCSHAWSDLEYIVYCHTDTLGAFKDAHHVIHCRACGETIREARS